MIERYYDEDLDEWFYKKCPFIGKECMGEECIFYHNDDCLILKCIEKVLGI